jgi:hypothetical protein
MTAPTGGRPARNRDAALPLLKSVSELADYVLPPVRRSR